MIKKKTTQKRKLTKADETSLLGDILRRLALIEAARYDVAIRCFKTEVQQVRTELKRSIEDVVDSRVIALMTERSARDFNTDERLTGLEEAIEIMKRIK